MRCVERNRQKIYYARYLGKTALTDENGRKTGEYTLSYSEPEKILINVSPANGFYGAENYGAAENYSHVLVTDDLHCPLDENCVLWFGISPEQPFNYVVSSVEKSLNSVRYKIKSAKTTG